MAHDYNGVGSVGGHARGGEGAAMNTGRWNGELVVTFDATQVEIVIPTGTTVIANGQRLAPYAAPGTYRVELHLTTDMIDDAQREAVLDEAISAIRKLKPRKRKRL